MAQWMKIKVPGSNLPMAIEATIRTPNGLRRFEVCFWAVDEEVRCNLRKLNANGRVLVDSEILAQSIS